ncbi:MAG: hypothetical protein OHK0053_27720 [Microscillaceae bacterium]
MSDAGPAWVLRANLAFGLLHLLVISEAQGQEEGNFRLAFAPERGQYTDRAITSFGIEMEYFWSDNFSMAYRFALGRNSDEVVFAQIPTGTWLASYPFTAYFDTNNEGLLYAALLALVIPESFNIHFWVGEKLRLSPYLSPLGMYYEGARPERRSPFRAGYSTGLRVYIITGDFNLCPYLGIRSLYQQGDGLGIVGGISMGISF